MVSKKKETIEVEDKRLFDYELVFIVSPEVNDEGLETAMDNVSRFIIDKGGVISEIDRWGKKKLAYPIKHFLEGHYVVARFQLSPAWCKELEKSLQISESILRHLLIKSSN